MMSAGELVGITVYGNAKQLDLADYRPLLQA